MHKSVTNEEVRRIAVIKQNACNQKTREHKEKIDPTPSEAQSEATIGNDAFRFSDDLASEVMPDDNEQNCNSPHAVELSYSFHMRERPNREFIDRFVCLSAALYPTKMLEYPGVGGAWWWL